MPVTFIHTRFCFSSKLTLVRFILMSKICIHFIGQWITTEQSLGHSFPCSLSKCSWWLGLVQAHTPGHIRFLVGLNSFILCERQNFQLKRGQITGEGEGKVSIYWCTPPMAAMIGVGLIQRQEPGPSSKPPAWVQGPMAILCFFSESLTGISIRSGALRLKLTPHIGCWCHKW